MQAKEKAVLDLAVKIAGLLAKHPSRVEAESACVIAQELFHLNAPRGITFLSSANKGLH